MVGKVKLVGMGGFLGSGKTTLEIELGKKIVTGLNKRVAIVTNDQGENLVDTNMVKDYGFAVTEVVGGCFCCRFPEFMAHIQEMMHEANPDILMAETVGSCTDFLATVYAPIRKYYGEQFDLAPFIVLIDATTVLDHFDKIHNLASPNTPVGELYSWQVKDADILAINKVDVANKEELPKIEALLRELNKEAEIIQISAKNGHNLDKLLRIITEGSHQPRPTITKEINYDTYATAEAVLGWFNGIYKVSSDRPLEVDRFMRDMLMEINRRVRESKGVIAHAKMRISTKEGSAKASLVISNESVGITGEVPPPSKEMDVILNIRAEIDPIAVTNIAKASLEAVCSKYNARHADWASTSFRPGYPKPYYRLTHT
jgi:G3E family GTPase